MKKFILTLICACFILGFVIYPTYAHVTTTCPPVALNGGTLIADVHLNEFWFGVFDRDNIYYPSWYICNETELEDYTIMIYGWGNDIGLDLGYGLDVGVFSLNCTGNTTTVPFCVWNVSPQPYNWGIWNASYLQQDFSPDVGGTCCIIATGGPLQTLDYNWTVTEYDCWFLCLILASGLPVAILELVIDDESAGDTYYIDMAWNWFILGLVLGVIVMLVAVYLRDINGRTSVYHLEV